jgi:hypothetical protein
VGLGFPLEDLTARMTELIQRDNVVLDGYIQTLHYMTALLRLLVRHGAHIDKRGMVGNNCAVNRPTTPDQIRLRSRRWLPQSKFKRSNPMSLCGQ